MESLKTLIIDDERLARELLKKYLEEFPEINLIGECANGFDAIKFINTEKPDLIFLDVQMPKLNGFEMLELIDSPPLVIFTTAYNQYAIKAFEVNAVDYLMKPFSEERLAVAVKKAVEKFKNTEKPLFAALPSTTAESFLERIVVKDGSRIFIIPAENIRYLEAQDDYVMIHTTDGKYLKQKTLKFYEENLNPGDFIRIHRSYIAAVKEIKQIELLEKETYQAILSDKKKLPVSKTGYEKLKEIFT
jgi:two-component system, LytTR family, response regulator